VGNKGLLNLVIKATDKASPNIRRVGQALGAMGKVGSSIKRDLKGAALGVAGLAAGVVAFSAQAVAAAAGDQASTDTLIATLKARKFNTDKLAGSIDNMIAKGQALAFTDDQVRGSIEASTRFTKKFSVAQKISSAAMDLSRATGMDLQEATIAVGKAFQGNGGKILKAIGINNKHLSGMKAINAILGKTKGASAAYANSAQGQFDQLNIQVSELKETFGKALLPAVTKVFQSLNPQLADFSTWVQSQMPKIQKFADTLANQIIARLPGLFAKLKTEIPKALGKVEDIAKSIGDIGKSADGLLGPGGSITVLVTAIGGAFGGLKGAITANLIKDGMDPFTALIVGNIAEQIPKALANALVTSIVNNAIAGYAAKMAAANTVSNVGSPGGPGGPGLFNLASIGAALKTFGSTVLAGIPVVLGAAAATGGAGIFPMFDPNSPGSLTGPDGILGFLNQSGNDQQKFFEAAIAKYTAQGVTQYNAYAAATYELGKQFNIGSYLEDPAYKAAYDRIAAGFGKAFGNTNDPMTAKYTSNIYIGDKKVDTVVSDSLTRITGTGHGRD